MANNRTIIGTLLGSIMASFSCDEWPQQGHVFSRQAREQTHVTSAYRVTWDLKSRDGFVGVSNQGGICTIMPCPEPGAGI